ncbi:hypothetical protein F4780DRAFT_742008 [Xylariomycetidae sp. FL0641]|nr:hypothetical protein F4780DRAFT_742008 [Xylariomycetidae sp. FL0641]
MRLLQTCLRGSIRPALGCNHRAISPLWHLSHERLSASHSSTRRFATRALIFPEPPTTEHEDEPSYRAYAERTGLDEGSNVFAGTLFEYQVASALRRLGFSLRRIGGRADRGIDLLGTWSVPSSPLPLRVLVQCKAAAPRTKIGPQHVRELEGAFAGAPPGWRGSGVVGLLVTKKHATLGMRDAMSRSKFPMVYAACGDDGNVFYVVWNQRAEEEGLGGMGATLQYGTAEDGSVTRYSVLTYSGKPLPSQQSSSASWSSALAHSGEEAPFPK